MKLSSNVYNEKFENERKTSKIQKVIYELRNDLKINAISKDLFKMATFPNI